MADREDRRRARGTGTTARAVEQEVPHEQGGRPVGAARDHRRDRLVPSSLRAQAVPAVQDVEGAQGKESVFKTPESSLKRRDVLGATRPTSRGPRAHQGARSGPEARRLRRRAGQVARWTPALQAAQPGAATGTTRVPERGVRPLPHPAARARFKAASTTEDRRQARLRVPSYGLRPSSSRTVREERLALLKVIQVQLDVRGPDFVANPISGKQHMNKDKAAAVWVAAYRPRSTPGSSELSD